MVDGEEEPSDEILVERCKLELPFNSSSYDLLVQRHMNHVYRMVYRMIPNHEDAEDITQDIFIKVFHTLPTFGQQASFSTWLYRVTVNSTVDAMRRLQRRRGYLFATFGNPSHQTHEDDQNSNLEDKASSHAGPEEFILQKEQRDCINSVLQRLNREQMQVLIMRDMDNLAYQDIAKLLGTGLGAVKMRIHRARLAFQELFLQFCEATNIALSLASQQKASSQAKKGRRDE